MALVSRGAARSGAGRRWLVIGIVLTLFVLLIDASLHSRSPGPGNQLATGAWVDRAVPIVATSTEEGQQLASIWAGGLHQPAASLTAELVQLASGATAAYRQAAALRPPDDLTGAAGLLDASLLSRSYAAQAVLDALGPILLRDGSAASPAGRAHELSGIMAAGQDLQLGDQNYHLFLLSLPKTGVTMPDSAWGGKLVPYQAVPAQAFVASLQSSMSATPVHQVTINSITTTPAAVSLAGRVQVVPAAPAITVTVVLSDTGNQAENNLTVTATAASARGVSTARMPANLTPGQFQTIEGIGPLDPAQGVDVRLTVTVTPPAGSSMPAVSRTLLFRMPAATTSATTSPSG